MSFTLSAPLSTFGDYSVRRVSGSVWDGGYAVTRDSDNADVLFFSGGREYAEGFQTEIFHGQTTRPYPTVAERMSKLTAVPTEALSALLITLDPYADWAQVRDVKMALKAR